MDANSKNLLDFIVDGFNSEGSFAMWAILVLSFLVLAIVIERVWFLFIKCGTSAGLLRKAQNYFKSGQKEKALTVVKSVNSPLAQSIAAVISNQGRSLKAVQRSVDEVFLKEVPKITKNIRFIETMANLATMTGLFGTIFGLMMSFDALANAPVAERSKRLAEGISVSMATTLFGLLAAIPGLFLQGLLSNRSDKVIEEMDEKSAIFINLLER